MRILRLLGHLFGYFFSGFFIGPLVFGIPALLAWIGSYGVEASPGWVWTSTGSQYGGYSGPLMFAGLFFGVIIGIMIWNFVSRFIFRCNLDGIDLFNFKDKSPEKIIMMIGLASFILLFVEILVVRSRKW
jgi:hypothetical protein